LDRTLCHDIRRPDPVNKDEAFVLKLRDLLVAENGAAESATVSGKGQPGPLGIC
jgi:hypothetical protein